VRYLTIDQVIELHDRVLSEHGGAAGIRSHHGLAYAVAAPQQTAFGEDAYPTLADRAAALGFFITMNHPFLDGNKRTGLAALETFLELNGFFLASDDDVVVDVFERLAGGEMEAAVFFTWVAAHVAPLPTADDER